MSKKSVVLGLFSDRFDVLVCMRDQVIASKRVEYAFGTDAAAWRESINDVGRKLAVVIDELKAGGLPAIVLYRNPTACSESSSLAISSAAQAGQAATLGCAESLSCTLDDSATATHVIGRDQTGEPRHTHVVVAADHDSAISAMMAMVAEAGVQFQSATPIDAVLMARVAGQALSSSATNQGYLYIGEHRSFFVIADQGRLQFCRQINLGSDSLIWSLTKPMRAANGAKPIELSLDDARGILYRAGVPKRDQIVHESLGLNGSQVIPLLQPVLQRFIVELRQSLRFGVADDRRQQVRLQVSGPGSAIPNLAIVLGTELGLKVEVDDRYNDYNCTESAGTGSEIRDAIEQPRLRARLELRPRQLAMEQTMRRVQRWMWAGSAAALAMIAGEAFHYHQLQAKVRGELHALEGLAANQDALQETGEKLFKAIAALETLESTIAMECGSSISVRASMQEFSKVTPDPIRLLNIAFSRDKDQTVGRLTGHAIDGNGGAGRLHIEPFVEQLKNSPLFENVMLSNVQSTTTNSMQGHQFVVTMIGVPVPRAGTVPTMTAASGGATP